MRKHYVIAGVVTLAVLLVLSYIVWNASPEIPRHITVNGGAHYRQEEHNCGWSATPCVVYDYEMTMQIWEVNNGCVQLWMEGKANRATCTQDRLREAFQFEGDPEAQRLWQALTQEHGYADNTLGNLGARVKNGERICLVGPLSNDDYADAGQVTC